jgi:uncharacterized Zn finger protein (UPF0148 family)
MHCEHCGGPLEYFEPEGEWYCPDCVRAALASALAEADAEARALRAWEAAQPEAPAPDRDAMPF